MYCNEIRQAIKDLSIQLSTRDLYDWLIFIIPTILTIVNVWIVNLNTNKQIKNQNKETYRPRLKVSNIERISSKEYVHSYYAHSKYFEEGSNKGNVKFKIQLENIGTGLANDIQFYMLNSGEKCLGYQVDNVLENQILDSTEEVPVGKSLDVYFNINFNRKKIKEYEKQLEGDFVILICNYQDLNQNNYNILIGISVKYMDWNSEFDGENELEKVMFDYYYYQEDTKNYIGMINKKSYSDNYKEILKKIKKKI